MKTTWFYTKKLYTFLSKKRVSLSVPLSLNANLLIRYLLFICLVFSVGCYLNATITDLHPKNHDVSPVFKVDILEGSEFVSGSDQYLMTQIRRYQIISSSGNYNREIKVTTPKGYSLYSSIQGTLISAQEGVR